MHLACCQLDIAWEDKPANYRRAEELLAAAELPPDTLVLLPEMFATGFSMNSKTLEEAIDGPTAKFLADLARRHRIFIQAGVVIRDEDRGRPRNEALVFAPDGRRLARYAKMYLFSYAGEPQHYQAGTAAVCFGWRDAIVAPAICYDLRFPELFRSVVEEGTQALTIIACWPAAREEHWLVLLRARAIENQCFVAAVNRCGRDPSGPAYNGRSQVIDPRGVVLADAGDQEGIIHTDIDMESLTRYRREFPALGDKRERERHVE